MLKKNTGEVFDDGMDAVICIKKNGKVKLVTNQFDLNALKRDDYDTYLYPVGIFGHVYKPINPQSGWAKPIKKIRVAYSLNMYMSGSFLVDEEYNEAVREFGVPKVAEFNDIISFVAFVVSMEKLASINVLKGSAFSKAVFMDLFEMEYIDIQGNKRTFRMTKKMAKSHNDVFYKMGFSVPNLVLELMDFFDDYKKVNFTHPALFNQQAIFVDKAFKRWYVGGKEHRDASDFLASVPLVQTGTITFVRSDVMHFLSMMHYEGKLSIISYQPSNARDITPLDTPVTVEVVEEYSGTFYELYDMTTFALLTAADFIEAAVMMPYYIQAFGQLGEITLMETEGGMDYMSQITLFPSVLTPAREVDPPPLKYMVYEEELMELDPDQSLRDFIKTLMLWVDKPTSVDGIDRYDDSSPF